MARKGRKQVKIETTSAVIAERLVPDPMMTDAEFIHQRRLEHDRAERQGRKPRLDVGKITATENAMTRIGALCFIRRRHPHQERAAEEFKSLYEARYGCGTPALDASREPVDRSIIAHDSGMASKLDRTRRLAKAEAGLSKDAFDRLVALLVLCVPAGDGLHWRSRRSAVDQVLADLDDLSSLWGLARRAA